MPAILFGSISTIADTSERQRWAFNEAFRTHGLSWNWAQEEYILMLEESGGIDRVASYATQAGQEVDAPSIHQTKSEIFRRSLIESPPPVRAGVVDTVHRARSRGIRLALVTSTSEENVSALMAAIEPELSSTDFDLIVSASDVALPKPDPAVYRFALDRLGELAGGCVAIEDNLGGLRAATEAGLACVAFPNENTSLHDFGAAPRVERLDLGELERLIADS